MTYEQLDKKCDNYRTNNANQKERKCTGFTFLKKDTQ